MQIYKTVRPPSNTIDGNSSAFLSTPQIKNILPHFFTYWRIVPSPEMKNVLESTVVELGGHISKSLISGDRFIN